MSKPTLKELQEEIEKVYLVKDPHITKVMAAAVIAHFLPADPVWPVIVAPSGGAKSEFINLIHKISWIAPNTTEEQKVHSLSTLTSKTFISGQKVIGRDTSLLLQISNGIITFKDLTSLLSENKDERSLIMAQLREIYDGKYAKSFGTGETLEWVGKISIIAGSTYAIHSMKQAYTAMGERFIFYNMEQPGRYDAAKRTMENQQEGKMREHRERLADLMRDYCLDVLNTMDVNTMTITPEQQKDTLELAELATRARSDVQRNWASREQEITEVHPPEMPTRFAGQLQTVIKALSILNQHDHGTSELQQDDFQILSKFSLDSITRARLIAMVELAKYETLETAGIATKIGMPTNSVRRWLEDLAALEIVDRVKNKGPQGDTWSIKPEYRHLITRYQGVDYRQGEDLTEANAEIQAEADSLMEAERGIDIDDVAKTFGVEPEQQQLS